MFGYNSLECGNYQHPWRAQDNHGQSLPIEYISVLYKFLAEKDDESLTGQGWNDKFM